MSEHYLSSNNEICYSNFLRTKLSRTQEGSNPGARVRGLRASTTGLLTRLCFNWQRCCSYTFFSISNSYRRDLDSASSTSLQTDSKAAPPPLPGSRFRSKDDARRGFSSCRSPNAIAANAAHHWFATLHRCCRCCRDAATYQHHLTPMPTAIG